MPESTTPTLTAADAKSALLGTPEPVVPPASGIPQEDELLQTTEVTGEIIDPGNQGGILNEGPLSTNYVQEEVPQETPVPNQGTGMPAMPVQQQPQQGYTPVTNESLFGSDTKESVEPTETKLDRNNQLKNAGSYENSALTSTVEDKVVGVANAGIDIEKQLGSPDQLARNDIRNRDGNLVNFFEESRGKTMDNLIQSLGRWNQVDKEIKAGQNRTWSEAAGDTVKALGVGVLNFTDIVPVLGQLGAMSMGERDSIFTSWMEGSAELKNQIRGAYSETVQAQDYLTNRASQRRKTIWEAENPNASTTDTLKFELGEFANTITEANYESVLTKVAENAPDLLASLVGYGFLKGGAKKTAEQLIDRNYKALLNEMDAARKGDLSSTFGKRIAEDRKNFKGQLTAAVDDDIFKTASLKSMIDFGAQAQAVREAATKSAAAKASLIGQGTAIAQEAGGSASAIRNEIAGMTEQDLSNSPEYAKLRDSGLTHEEARSELANKAMARVAAIVGVSQAGIGKVTGAFDAPLKAMTGIKGIRDSVLGITGAAGREGLEESLIGAASTLAEGQTKQDLVDPNQRITENLGRNIAEGALVGSALGGGVTTAAEASNIFRDSKYAIKDAGKKVKETIDPKGDGGYSLAQESSEGFAQILDSDKLTEGDDKTWKENFDEYANAVEDVYTSEDVELTDKKDALFTAAKQAETAAKQLATKAEEFEKAGETDKADIANARSNELRKSSEQIRKAANRIEGVSTSQQAKIDAEKGTTKAALKAAANKAVEGVGAAGSATAKPIKKASTKLGQLVDKVVDKAKRRGEAKLAQEGVGAKKAFNQGRNLDGSINTRRKKLSKIKGTDTDELSRLQGARATLEEELEAGNLTGPEAEQAKEWIREIDEKVGGIVAKPTATLRTAEDKLEKGQIDTITKEEAVALYDQVSNSPDKALSEDAKKVIYSSDAISLEQKQYIRQVLAYQDALKKDDELAKKGKNAKEVNRDIRKGGVDPVTGREYRGIANYAQDIQVALNSGDTESIKYSLGKLSDFISIQKTKLAEGSTKARSDVQLSGRAIKMIKAEIELLTAFESAMQRRISNQNPDFVFDRTVGGLNTEELKRKGSTAKIKKSESANASSRMAEDRTSPSQDAVHESVELALETILSPGFKTANPEDQETLYERLLELNDKGLSVEDKKAAKAAIEKYKSDEPMTAAQQRKANKAINKVYNLLTGEFGSFENLVNTGLGTFGGVTFNTLNKLLNFETTEIYDSSDVPEKMVYKKLDEITKAKDITDTKKKFTGTYAELHQAIKDAIAENSSLFSEEELATFEALPVPEEADVLDKKYVANYNKMVNIINRAHINWYSDFDVAKGERFVNPHPANRVFQQDLQEAGSEGELGAFTTNVEDPGLLQTEDNLFQKLNLPDSLLTDYVAKNVTKSEMEAIEFIANIIANNDGFAVKLENILNTPSKNKNEGDIVNTKHSPMLEFVRSNGSVSTSITAVIALSSFNWLQRRSSQVLFNEDDAVRAMARLKDKEPIIGSLRSSYRQGVTMETFVHEVGADVVRNMGLELLPEQQQHLMEDLITSAGQMVLKAMEVNNLVDVTYVHKLDDVGGANKNKPVYIRNNKSTPEKGYTVVNKLIVPRTEAGKPKAIDATTKRNPEEVQGTYKVSTHIRNIIDSMTSLDRVMDEFFGLKGTPQGAILGTAELEPPKRGTDNIEVAPMQDKGLRNYINIEYGIDDSTFALLMAFDDDYLIENFGGFRASGITPAHLEHEDNKEANAANREKVREQIQALRDLKDALDTGNYGGVVKFMAIVGQNKRMTMLGINPQSSRIWREVVKPKAFEVEIDPTKDVKLMKSLKEAIAAAMGFDTDKQGDAKTLADYDTLVKNQEVMDAVEELRKATTEKRTVNLDIIKKAFGGKSPKPEQIQGLSAMASMSSDKPFKVNIGKENDGVTNGLAFNLFQFAPAESYDDFVKRANRVGILKKGDTDFGQHLEQEANEDSYEDLLSVIRQFLADPTNPDNGNVSGTFPKIFARNLDLANNMVRGDIAVDNQSEFSKITAGVGFLLNPKGRELSQEAFLKTIYAPGENAVRDLAKDPLMQFLYQAGISGLQTNMVYQAYSGLLSAIEEANAITDPEARERAFSSIELAVFGATFKSGIQNDFSIDRSDPLKAIPLKTAKKLLAGLEVGVKLTYGKALDTAFKTKYSIAKQLGDRFTGMTRIAARTFIAIYDKRYKERLKETGQTSLTREQQAELIEELKDPLPMYATPLDEDGDRYGVLGLKREAKPTGRQVVSTFNMPESSSNSVTSTNQRVEYTDPAVSMGPILIQSLDASAIVKTMLENIMVSVHDAIIAGMSDVDKATFDINKAWMDINTQHMLFAVVEEQLIKTLSYPGAMEGEIGEAVKKAMKAEKTTMGLDDTFVEAPNAIDNLLAYMKATREAMSTNRSLMTRTGVVVNQYFGNSETGVPYGDGDLTDAEARDLWRPLPTAAEFNGQKAIQDSPGVFVDNGKVTFKTPKDRNFVLGIGGTLTSANIPTVVEQVLKFAEDNGIDGSRLTLLVNSNKPELMQRLKLELMTSQSGISIPAGNIGQLDVIAHKKDGTTGKRKYTKKDSKATPKTALTAAEKASKAKEREAELKKAKKARSDNLNANADKLAGNTDAVILVNLQTDITDLNQQEDAVIKRGKPVIRINGNNIAQPLYDTFAKTYTSQQEAKLVKDATDLAIIQLGLNALTDKPGFEHQNEAMGTLIRAEVWDGENVLNMSLEDMVRKLRAAGYSDAEIKQLNINAKKYGAQLYEYKEANKLTDGLYDLLGGEYTNEVSKNTKIKNALLALYDADPKFKKTSPTANVINKIFGIIQDKVKIVSAPGPLSSNGRSVNGFYDPSTNTIVIREGLDGAALRAVLFEEVDHAASGISFRETYGQMKEGTIAKTNDKVRAVNALQAIWEQVKAAKTSSNEEIRKAAESAAKDLAIIESYGSEEAQLEELMAWGKTNYNMINLLKKVKIKIDSPKSGFKGLLDAAIGLLGLKKLKDSKEVSAYELLIGASQPFYNATAGTDGFLMQASPNSIYKDIITMPKGAKSVILDPSVSALDPSIEGKLTADAMKLFLTEFESLDISDDKVKELLNGIYAQVSGKVAGAGKIPLGVALNNFIKINITPFTEDTVHKRAAMAALSLINGLESVNLIYKDGEVGRGKTLKSKKLYTTGVLSTASRTDNIGTAIGQYSPDGENKLRDGLISDFSTNFEQLLEEDNIPDTTIGILDEIKSRMDYKNLSKDQQTHINGLVNYIRKELNTAVAAQSRNLERKFLQINDNAAEFSEMTGDVTHDRLLDVFEGLGQMNDTVTDSIEHTEHLGETLAAMKPVVNRLKLTLSEALNDSASAGQSKTSKEMLSSIDLTIQTRAKVHSLQMSGQELFVHEVAHTVIHNADRRSKAWKVIEEQFRHARSKLKPEHFLTDVVGATEEDKKIAKATYDHIFVNSIGAQEYTTRLGLTKLMYNDDPLAEFAVMSWTNHAFRKALSNMAAEEKGEGTDFDKEQNMYRKLASGFGSVLGAFTKDVISNENLGADEKMMEALTYIIGAENQKRNSVYSVKSFGESGLDSLDDVIKDIAIKTNDAVTRRLNKSDSKIFRNTGTLLETLKPGYREEAMKSYRKVMNAIGATRSDTLVAVYNELTTGRKSLREISRLLAASSQMIEQNPLKLQSYIATELPENFSRDLTEEESAAISTLLEMDTGYLLNNGYNYDKLVEIIRSPEKAQQTIDDLYTAMKSSELPGIKSMAQYLRAHSEDLGYHLLTYGRKYPAGMYTNAYQIAHLDGYPRDEVPKKWDAAKVEPYVDELASLYAIRTLQESKYAKQQYKNIVKLLDTQKRGMASTLVTHDVISKDAKETLFKNDPRQMRKGYLRNKNNSQIDVVVGTAAEHADLIALGYSKLLDEAGAPRRVYTDPTGADKQEPKYYYSMKNGSNNAHLSAAMSLASKGSRGINIIDINTHPGGEADMLTTIQNTQRLKKEKTKLLLDMARTGGKQLPVAKRGSVAQPTFDSNGNVQAYRYPMTRRTMDEIMQPDRDFAQLMGITAASNLKRENTTEINSQVLDYMYKTFVTEYSEFPDEFIRLSPNSTKKSERDAWFKMPEEARVKAAKMWGGEVVYVKRAEYDIVFGYQKWSVGDLRYQSIDPDAALLQHLMTWLNNFAAVTFANQYGIKLESFIQEGVRVGKDAIVIKTGVVTAANIMSNLMLLRMRGIPLSQSIPDTIEAYKAAWEYREEEREIFSMRMKLKRGDLSPKQQATLESDVAVLQKKLQVNPVRELMEAGVFQSIVEDVDTLRESPLTEEFGVVEKIEKYVPEAIVNVGKVALMTHDTKVYSLFRDMAQFSDFAARYSNHKYNMGKGMNFEDSINDIMTTFINYDIPQHKAMQYMNDMGVLSFTKYLMRVQQVILKTFAEKPATFLGTALLSDALSMVHYQMGASIDDSLIGFDAISKQFENMFSALTAGTETAPINLAMDSYKAVF